MKVLHVITGLGVGGAEMQLWSVLRHTRHEADVVTLYNPGAVADRLNGDHVHVRDLGMRRNTQLTAVLTLRRMIRKGRYDVVHAHLYRACIYARPAAWLARTPAVVTSEHSIGDTHIERRKMTAGVRALYLGTDLCSDATIAVSDTVRDRLVNWGVPARKITVIPNGVDFSRVAFSQEERAQVRREHGIPAAAFVLGVLGRLDPIKRFDLVIEAAAPMLDDQHKLLIVGDGDQRAHLEQVARTLGVQDDVIFAGERHDVGAMLSALDAFVASSSQETFGLSVLEALANGLPALYTTCPALDDVPTERARQVAGTVDAIRGELVAMAHRPPGPREPAPEVEKHYGIETVVARIDDLYESLVPRPRHTTRRNGEDAGGRWLPGTPNSAAAAAPSGNGAGPAGQRGRSQ
jgi:glycosyltransferase involved in cell wall biosynthesis